MMQSNDKIEFVSLGGVWLDELRWPSKSPRMDVVGGSATYSTLGARMFSSIDPSCLCLVIQAGYDFPDEVLKQLEGWGVLLSVIRHRHNVSTRGVLEHTAVPGHARFTRLTPPLLTSAHHLAKLNLLNSKFVHVFGTPEIARTEFSQLDHLRQATSLSIPDRAHIIWEPHPKSCTSDLLAEHIDLLKSGCITVFSPNHFELAAFFSIASADTVFDRKTVELQAGSIWTSLAQCRSQVKQCLPALIIRAAEHGCMLLTWQQQIPVWLPAFWGPEQQDRVVDTTGAGNAFLGALTQGWIETESWVQAACYATVAASIVVEHVGVPTLHHNDSTELWSGIDVRERLGLYMAREEVQQVLFEG